MHLLGNLRSATPTTSLTFVVCYERWRFRFVEYGTTRSRLPWMGVWWIRASKKKKSDFSRSALNKKRGGFTEAHSPKPELTSIGRKVIRGRPRLAKKRGKERPPQMIGPGTGALLLMERPQSWRGGMQLGIPYSHPSTGSNWNTKLWSWSISSAKIGRCHRSNMEISDE